jgi:hypothetical protein
MPFQNNYANLVTEKPQAHTRLIRDYDGSNKDFDFIIIGSGIGGGILADDLSRSIGAKSSHSGFGCRLLHLSNPCL